jgi:hypothetical protein
MHQQVCAIGTEAIDELGLVRGEVVHDEAISLAEDYVVTTS